MRLWAEDISASDCCHSQFGQFCGLGSFWPKVAATDGQYTMSTLQ
jgi:hypothetical protein